MAENLQSMQGWGAWPSCSARSACADHQLITADRNTRRREGQRRPSSLVRRATPGAPQALLGGSPHGPAAGPGGHWTVMPTPTDHRPLHHSGAWVVQTQIALAVSLGGLGIGVAYLPVGPWPRAFLALAVLFTVSSSFSLAKTLRDQHESRPRRGPGGRGQARAPADRARPLPGPGLTQDGFLRGLTLRTGWRRPRTRRHPSERLPGRGADGVRGRVPPAERRRRSARGPTRPSRSGATSPRRARPGLPPDLTGPSTARWTARSTGPATARWDRSLERPVAPERPMDCPGAVSCRAVAATASGNVIAAAAAGQGADRRGGRGGREGRRPGGHGGPASPTWAATWPGRSRASASASASARSAATRA